MKTFFTPEFTNHLGDKLNSLNTSWNKEVDDFKKYFEAPKAKEFHLEKADNGWQLSVLIAGYDKDEISIEAKGSYIEITATKKKKETYNDLITSSIYRNILVGDIDTENIQARLSNGILWLDIPSKERKSKVVIK
jgi:HSP20 family molecular chaperone IbpA